MEQLVGTTLGRYRIERLLGRGGMALVYQATDPAFGRTVAIKVLSTKLADEPQYVERFLREARSMARLQHPHILPVYDVGEQDGSAYLVMLYVDGGSLHERLAATRQGKRLSLRDLLTMMRPVADALDYAHRHGVIHRDVKPQNILLTTQGYPFLTDFGIAKIMDNASTGGASLTLANTVIGTPDYMSPEQGQGLPLDGRADLYSLGVILYEVFTGRTPFRVQTATETPLAIMMRHITSPPPPPRGINPQLPEALEAVLLRALAKQPDDRYPTGIALLDALEVAVESVRLPQSQGGAAQASLSDFRLPSSPTPPPGWSGTNPSNQGQSNYSQPAASAPYTNPSVGAGASPQYAAASAPLPRGNGQPPPPSGPLPLPLAQTPNNPNRQEKRSLVPLALGGAAVALIVLVAIFALRALAGGGTAAGTAPTNTVAGSAVVAGGPTMTATASSTATTGTGATLPSASAAPSASVVPSASGKASAGPSASASASSSATPVPSAGALGTPVGQTKKQEVIFFASHRNGVHESQIYRMNIDGSGQRILLDTKGHSWGPRVSPDGKFVVFSTVIGEHNNHTATGGGEQGIGHHEVFRAKTDGSDIQQITKTDPPIWNNAWAWSPDSKSIVFASDRDGNWELYRMGADGSNVTRLTTNPAQDGWPSWSPDGKSIVFASDRDGGLSQIYIMDADGKNVRRLVFSESYDTLPSISPDGKSIVYSSQSGEFGEIYTMELGSTAPVRLTSTVAMNTDPSWSPDGKSIVFTSDRDRNTNIYMMDRDGKNQKRLTDDPGEDVTPYWAVIEVAADTPAGDVQAVRLWPDDMAAVLPGRREW